MKLEQDQMEYLLVHREELARAWADAQPWEKFRKTFLARRGVGGKALWRLENELAKIVESREQ